MLKGTKKKNQQAQKETVEDHEKLLINLVKEVIRRYPQL
jgi:hypothetical protein